MDRDITAINIELAQLRAENQALKIEIAELRKKIPNIQFRDVKNNREYRDY